MLIYPAIDLFDGKAVRLYHGDYAQMTVYSEQPCEVAADFLRCGASVLHTVDLQGAKTGQTPNEALILRLIRESGLRVQVGGGIRSEDAARRYLDAGAARVILGTAAVTQPALLETLCAKYGKKIAVGVDLKDGYVATHGWTQKSTLTAADFLTRLQALGVGAVICTDISRDGAMQGTNRALYAALSQQFELELIASGGVSCMDDIRALKVLGLAGAIVGKAYYTGALDLKEAIEVATC